MVWKIDNPQGNETAKVRFDLVPYMRGRVLDLGCGESKVFGHAIGIDNRIDAKAYGLNVDPDIAVDTCERMPMFADESADTVYSSHLLEHITDWEGALKEWWRLVKVGGYLVLYLPAKGHYPDVGETGCNPDHKFTPTQNQITDGMIAIAKATGRGWEQVENELRTADQEYSFLQVYRKTDNPVYTRYKPREKPAKTLGLVRLGAFGDALWISGLLPHWKREGYHITVYTQMQGELMLRHDPNIDRIICQPDHMFAFPDGKIGMWQTAYWLHEERKYDEFINLIGSTERRLLPQSFEPDFYLPAPQRRRVMNRNYLEALHEWAGVPFERTAIAQKFYPSPEESKWAEEQRASVNGPLVLINPAGSSAPKWWPHAQQLADMLAAERITSLIVGDLRGAKLRPAGKFGKIVGMQWPIRHLLALAQLADVVVGTESVLVNSVAFADPLKIVLLSHSTHENLTRDWRNTLAVEPEGLACYPCHRIHTDVSHCTIDTDANAAACQSAAKPELVLQHIVAWLDERGRRAA